MYIYDRKLSDWPFGGNRRVITLRPSGRELFRDYPTGVGEPDEKLEDSIKAIRAALPKCASFDALRRILRGQGVFACRLALQTTRGGNEIEAFFFPGRGPETALVIAGVHGSELSGIEVAHRLVKLLFDELAGGIKPHFNVWIIPVLFPDNAAIARGAHTKPGDDNNTGRITDRAHCSQRMQSTGRTECVDPNRQFPTPGRPFDPKIPVDSLGTEIEPENVALLAAIDLLKPNRVASIHAHKMPAKMGTGTDGPGIFADPHAVGPKATPAEVKLAQDRTNADCELAKRMAQKFLTEYKSLTTKDGGGRIPGNWVKSGKPTVCEYGSKAFHQCGVSLGTWGPRAIPGVRDSLTIITMEVRHYYDSSATGKPVAGKTGETADGARHRTNELKSHLAALRHVFLETP
jgi:predicted deacylase